MKKIGELSEKERWVKREREEGKRTFRAIGKEMGIGGQRVAQIYHRAVWEVTAERENPYCGLGNHAAELLSRNDIGSREEVRAIWDGKRLRVRYGRGLGVRTRNEILRWAGIKEPVAKEVERCRLCGAVLRRAKNEH